MLCAQKWFPETIGQTDTQNKQFNALCGIVEIKLMIINVVLYNYLDILVILTPHSGNIDPPLKNIQRTLNLTKLPFFS